jgi:hypothetical protein
VNAGRLKVDSGYGTVRNGCMGIQYSALSGMTLQYVFEECRSPLVETVARATALAIDVSLQNPSKFKRIKVG